jgi:hypothetical protein
VCSARSFPRSSRATASLCDRWPALAARCPQTRPARNPWDRQQPASDTCRAGTVRPKGSPKHRSRLRTERRVAPQWRYPQFRVNCKARSRRAVSLAIDGRVAITPRYKYRRQFGPVATWAQEAQFEESAERINAAPAASSKPSKKHANRPTAPTTPLQMDRSPRTRDGLGQMLGNVRPQAEAEPPTPIRGLSVSPEVCRSHTALSAWSESGLCRVLVVGVHRTLDIAQ